MALLFAADLDVIVTSWQLANEVICSGLTRMYYMVEEAATGWNPVKPQP